MPNRIACRSQSRSLTVGFLCLTWLLPTTGFGQGTLYEEQIPVFGTLVTISLWGVEPDQARRAVKNLAEEFQRMHRTWHAWQPGPLTEINRAFAKGQTVMGVDPSLLSLIRQSQDLYRLSAGLFNPAIGQLIALWGFHSDELPRGPPPSKETIAALVVQNPNMDDLEIQGTQVRSRNPAVQLDFGAIAKGYALDLAVQRLREMGIKDALVNAGGGLSAIGQHGDRPWRVGIYHPQGHGILASIELRSGETMHTSGTYERYREHQAIHYPHILDPRTGYPASEILSATVISHNGALTDAAATALVVAGPKGWPRIARQLRVKYVLVVDSKGTISMSPAMAKRIQFKTKPPLTPVIIESPSPPQEGARGRG